MAVELITPAANERFYSGSDLTVKLKVTENGLNLGSADAFCRLLFSRDPTAVFAINLSPEGGLFSAVYNIEKDSVIEEGAYYGEYEIGSGDPAQAWILKCTATSGGDIADISIPLKIVNEPILLEFLSPSETVVDSGKKINVMVRAYYQNNNPVKNALVVLEDSDGRSSRMNMISDSGFYEFSGYGVISNGNYLSLTAIAVDGEGNAGSHSIIIRIIKNQLPEMAYKLWWTIPVLMVIILMTLYLEKQLESSYSDKISRPRKIREMIADLQEERHDIIESKSSAENNYNSRKINENSFGRITSDYLRKLNEIETKIRELKRELDEFV
ncbi:MAG: hypothetical protein HYT71_01895 [Candidatus Aenigmarchaeota archaeon]|nr:hypothetical protein [Candidatus Aenigmarchaeota archaeon]